MEDQTVSFSLEKTVAHLIADHIGHSKINYEISEMNNHYSGEKEYAIVVWLGQDQVVVFCKTRFRPNNYPYVIAYAPLFENTAKRKITNDCINTSWLTTLSFPDHQQRINKGEKFIYAIRCFYDEANISQAFLYYYDGLLGLFDKLDNDWRSSMPVSQQDAFDLMKFVVNYMNKKTNMIVTEK